MIVAPRRRFQGGLSRAGLEARPARANAGAADAQPQPFSGEALVNLRSVARGSQGYLDTGRLCQGPFQLYGQGLEPTLCGSPGSIWGMVAYSPRTRGWKPAISNQ